MPLGKIQFRYDKQNKLAHIFNKKEGYELRLFEAAQTASDRFYIIFARLLSFIHEIFDPTPFIIFPEIRTNAGYFQREAEEIYPGERSLCP